MVLYMAVTCDKYELPLYVTDDRKDMARFAGVLPDTVSMRCSRNENKPPYTGPPLPYIRLRRVIIDEMEEEELDEI